MRRNETISISVRGFFARRGGTHRHRGDTLLAVNKMKRVYCKESLAGIKYDYPDIIGDIQSLLLGRAVVLQSGELSRSQCRFLRFPDLFRQIPYIPEAAWSLTFPRGRSDEDEFGYEYRINSIGQTEKLTLELSHPTTNSRSRSITLLTWTKVSTSTYLFTRDFNKKFGALIEFNDIDWEANAPSPVSLNSRFTCVGIKQFISSF